MGQEASPEMLARGAALYSTNCQSCHGGASGGSLKDIPPPHNANGHTWHHPDQQLMDMVMNGITFSLEDQKMPAFKGKLTEEDVKAILAYIKTWWTQEQREHQKEVTRPWEQ
jgi:mono/diheme cytochrome c family protein